MMKTSRNKVNTAATFLYLVAAVFYFLPVAVPHKIAIGLAILSLASIGRTHPYITVAFVMSFLGDLAGSYSPVFTSKLPFIFQMSFFAIGHAFFATYFIKGSPKMGNIRKRIAALAMAIIITGASITVIPSVTPRFLAVGIFTYVVLISLMMYGAIATRKTGIIVGAALFVFSDFTLAVNMFVTAVPAENYLIMATYYSAQLLLFLSTVFSDHLLHPDHIEP